MPKGRKMGQDGESGGLTYFVQAGGRGGPIKIGATRHLEKRMRALATAHYEELTVLGALPHDNYDEDYLLARFHKHRIRGEWFRPVPELVELAELAGWHWALTRRFEPIWPALTRALGRYRQSPESQLRAEAAFNRWMNRPQPLA